jgi:branched-subunit amino acid ABC-type transport system permease component
MFTFTNIGQIVWAGLATSTYLVLSAVAFALVLKVVRLFNFAQAGLMGIAFFASYWAIQELGLSIWIGVPIGLAITLGVTFVLEYYGFRTLRIRRSSVMSFFIFTLVFSEFVAYVLTLLFGTFPQTLLEQIFWPVTLVFGIAVSAWDLPAILITIGALVLLHIGLTYSRQGQFMTAVADNPELAELYGIDKNRVFMWALMAAATLGFIAMCLYGTRAQVHPTTSLDLLLFAVVATILGGIGKVFGAALAAVVVNLIQKLSILAIPSEWEGVLLYGFLFFAIIFFPDGFRLPRRRLRFKTGTRQLAAGDAAAE